MVWFFTVINRQEYVVFGLIVKVLVVRRSAT